MALKMPEGMSLGEGLVSLRAVVDSAGEGESMPPKLMHRVGRAIRNDWARAKRGWPITKKTLLFSLYACRVYALLYAVGALFIVPEKPLVLSWPGGWVIPIALLTFALAPPHRLVVLFCIFALLALWSVVVTLVELSFSGLGLTLCFISMSLLMDRLATRWDPDGYRRFQDYADAAGTISR